MSDIVNQFVGVDSCYPHPDNYNRHPPYQIERLRESLRAFEQVRSVVVQDDGQGGFVLVAGEGLWTAAKIEGLELLRADVIPPDWPAVRVKAYVAADNELARLGDPDLAQLAALAAGTEERLKELVGGLNGKPPEDPGPQVDKAAELQEVWQVQTGDLWVIPSKTADGEHRVICGDCTDAVVNHTVMQDDMADLGLTSPPYAVGKEYEQGISFDQHLSLLRGFADRAIELIKAGGFLFTNFGEIAAQSHTKPLTGSDRQCLYPISKDYWEIFHIERGMDLYAMRIWYKPFNRLQQPFWTYHTSIPHHQEWEHIWTWRLPGGNADECYEWDISSRAIWDTRKEAVDDKPLTRHVAAFPVCLPERCLKAHSFKGAIVWEPFLGSGTTLAACERLGRLGRGIEIEPKYVAVCLERLSQMGLSPQRVEAS